MGTQTDGSAPDPLLSIATPEGLEALRYALDRVEDIRAELPDALSKVGIYEERIQMYEERLRTYERRIRIYERSGGLAVLPVLARRLIKHRVLGR